MRWFRDVDLAVETKPDLTPVTAADREVERLLRGLIERDNPGDAVLGEEYGSTGDSARRWIVDPIDGTKSYVRGVPVWATLLALERDGEVCCGLVSAPALGRRWWAERGEGAFADGTSLHVSSVASVADAMVSLTSPHGMPPGWHSLAAEAWAPRGWADFWQHCLVAEGAVDVGCDPVVNLWDFA